MKPYMKAQGAGFIFILPMWKSQHGKILICSKSDGPCSRMRVPGACLNQEPQNQHSSERSHSVHTALAPGPGGLPTAWDRGRPPPRGVSDTREQSLGGTHVSSSSITRWDVGDPQRGAPIFQLPSTPSSQLKLEFLQPTGTPGPFV